MFGNHFIISSEFGMLASLPDNLKAAISIKNAMDILEWVKNTVSPRGY